MIKLLDCIVEVIRREEDFTSIAQHFDCGDPEYHEQDQETIKKVTEDYNNGNLWAWCDIEIRVSFPIGNNKETLSVSKYLGCSSYSNEEEFRKDSNFDDMQKEAFEELVLKLMEARKMLNEVFAL